jgi:hypothetical protein
VIATLKLIGWKINKNPVWLFQVVWMEEENLPTWYMKFRFVRRFLGTDVFFFQKTNQ